MKKMNLVSAVVLAFSASCAYAEQFRVVGVSDGDTVRVLSSDNRQMKCRLHGIDAPESSQPHGQASKASLSDMIYRKTVDVEVVDRDQYGRSVCRIFLSGVDVNKVQIQRGFAWWYSRYSKDASYSQAQNAARQHRLGLWADPSPTPPWAFRKEGRSNDLRY
jgi:endonuclease YncB( thermonuclease family)